MLDSPIRVSGGGATPRYLWYRNYKMRYDLHVLRRCGRAKANLDIVQKGCLWNKMGEFYNSIAPGWLRPASAFPSGFGVELR